MSRVYDLSYGRDIIALGGLVTFLSVGGASGWSDLGVIAALVSMPIGGLLAREIVTLIGATALAIKTRRAGHDFDVCDDCGNAEHHEVDTCPECGGSMTVSARMYDGGEAGDG